MNLNVALTTQNLTINSDNSSIFTCGQYINIPGRFSSGQTIKLFTLTSLASHVQYRFFVWVLWIDNWAANNNITVSNGTNTVVRTNYSSANSR